MNNSRLISLAFLGLLLACVAALSGCESKTTPATEVAATDPVPAAAPPVEPDLFAQRAGNEFDPATIDAIGDAVADWQIAVAGTTAPCTLA